MIAIVLHSYRWFESTIKWTFCVILTDAPPMLVYGQNLIGQQAMIGSWRNAGWVPAECIEAELPHSSHSLTLSLSLSLRSTEASPNPLTYPGSIVRALPAFFIAGRLRASNEWLARQAAVERTMHECRRRHYQHRMLPPHLSLSNDGASCRWIRCADTPR